MIPTQKKKKNEDAMYKSFMYKHQTSGCTNLFSIGKKKKKYCWRKLII